VWWGGGQHYALQATGIKYEVLQALDMNEVANSVYAHNFPTVPVSTVQCPGQHLPRHLQSCVI
jgi:site-specific DNA-cytosine methylase